MISNPGSTFDGAVGEPSRFARLEEAKRDGLLTNYAGPFPSPADHQANDFVGVGFRGPHLAHL
jgi:hypothetical protein